MYRENENLEGGKSDDLTQYSVACLTWWFTEACLTACRQSLKGRKKCFSTTCTIQRTHYFLLQACADLKTARRGRAQSDFRLFRVCFHRCDLCISHTYIYIYIYSYRYIYIFIFISIYIYIFIYSER